MNERELTTALSALAREIRFPPTPDLVGPVRTEIARGRTPRGRRFESDLFRRAAFVGAAVTAAFVALLTFSPATREAIADFLGISGVEVRTEPGGPSPTAAVIAPDVGLGDPVPLSDAEAATEFPVALPRSLGEPDVVYLDTLVPGNKVSVVYENVVGAPGIGDSDIGVVISQFPGDLNEAYVEKTVHLGATKVDAVEVNGAPGFFIVGGPHEVLYLTPDGSERRDTLRLAANTLLWERNGVAFRLETSLGRSGALEVAESLE